MGPTCRFCSWLLIACIYLARSADIINGQRGNGKKLQNPEIVIEDILFNKEKLKHRNQMQVSVTANKVKFDKPLHHSHNNNNDNSIPKHSNYTFEKFDRPIVPKILKSFYSGLSRRFLELDAQRNDDYLDQRDQLISALWSILRHGRLQTFDNDVASVDNIKMLLMPTMLNGTALVVGACDVSIAHAEMSKSNTVLSVFLDHSSSQECESLTLKKSLSNVLISHMDGDKVIKSILLSKDARFDFIFIKEFEKLTLGLLPQEIEDVMKNLLSVSRRLLFSLNLQDAKAYKIFTSSWSKPKDLVQNICARLTDDGSCTGKIVDGSEKIWIPLLAFFKNNKSLDSDGCGDEGLPLQMLLSQNLTSHCRRHLFNSLVTSGLDGYQENTVYISGQDVIKSNCQSRESQSVKTSHLPYSYTERSEESQSGRPTATSFKSLRNPFDIVDGRPVEEEFILTKGYQELAQDELKSSPSNSQEKKKVLPSSTQPNENSTKQNRVFGRTLMSYNVNDPLTLNHISRSKFQKFFDNKVVEENSFVIKRNLKSDSKTFGDSLLSKFKGSDGASRTNKMTHNEQNYTLGTHAKRMRNLFLDESRYKFMLDTLSPHLNEMFTNGKAVTVSGLISGSCHMSMLSAKLSMTHPKVSLITLDVDKHQDCSKKFGSLLDNAEISNNFMIRDELSPDVLYQMSHAPQLFDFQILGPEMFSWMPQSRKQEFLDYFTRILMLSRVTFLEMPSWQTLKAAIRIFQRSDAVNEDYDSFEDFLSASLLTTNSHLWKLDDISKSLQGERERMQLWKVELQSFEREVFMTCNDGSASSVKLNYNRPSAILVSDDKQATQETFRGKGLNLKMLLSLYVTPEHRRRLFESYLRVPLYEDMCPSRIVWNHGQLHHVDEALAQSGRLEQLQVLTQFINSQIHQSVFSFVDYNSPNKYIGTSLARKHLHSTFLLPEYSKTSAERKALATEKDGLNNSLVLHLPVTKEFSHNLMKSPDIMRYQFIDLVRLLTYEDGSNKENFKKMMGELLSSGLTNFVLVPSSEILSLATSTIFPGVFVTQPYLISNAYHFFENVERNLLKQVDHHFQFEIDHHERKYIQHVDREGPGQQPRVFLVREEDDYRIGYGNVSAISLIALLRMGMLPSTKERLYTLFLQLPLQEDMAPWNIVFTGGRLTYIDQDTRDTTFDKLIPMAYQIISVLINYERTVNDFGHCGEKANTQYGIGHVASCVHSMFQGPCTDSRYPVPCGDMSCQPTYIHCLRALQTRLKRATGTLGQGMRKRTLSDDKNRRRQWEFDNMPVVPKKSKVLNHS